MDFHPRIRHPYPDGQLVDLKCCELDEEVVQNKEVERLVDTLDGQGRAQLHQISHRPRAMTDFFLEMYQSRIQDLESNLRGWDAELHTPRIPSERRRELRGLIDWGQAELDRIKAYTEPLEAYQARLDELTKQEKIMDPFLSKARNISQFPDTKVLGLVASTERVRSNGIKKPHLNSLFVPLNLNVEGWDRREDYLAEFKNDRQVEFSFKTFKDVRDAILNKDTPQDVRTKAHYLLKYIYSNVRKTPYWNDIVAGVFSGE